MPFYRVLVMCCCGTGLYKTYLALLSARLVANREYVIETLSYKTNHQIYLLHGFIPTVDLLWIYFGSVFDKTCYKK